MHIHTCIYARMIKYTQFLESWVGMGMSLIFLAVATSDKANNSKGYGEYVNIHIIDVICYSIMVVGFMFSVLGCCGGKSLRKR